MSLDILRSYLYNCTDVEIIPQITSSNSNAKLRTEICNDVTVLSVEKLAALMKSYMSSSYYKYIKVTKEPFFGFLSVCLHVRAHALQIGALSSKPPIDAGDGENKYLK